MGFQDICFHVRIDVIFNVNGLQHPKMTPCCGASTPLLIGHTTVRQYRLSLHICMLATMCPLPPLSHPLSSFTPSPGVPLELLRDPSSSTIMLASNEALQEVGITNEGKDMWRIYLDHQVGGGTGRGEAGGGGKAEEGDREVGGERERRIGRGKEGEGGRA